MTYKEIKASDRLYLVSADIADIMECNAYSLTCQAREHPETLPFPVIRIGKVTKYPRIQVLRYCEDVLGLK